MALFRFLKTPEPSQYNYKPQHWDPEKERIERRLAELESQKEELTANDVKDRLSGSFRNVRTSGNGPKLMRTEAKRRSNFTLIAIIMVLGLLAYAVLNVNLQSILEFVE